MLSSRSSFRARRDPSGDWQIATWLAIAYVVGAAILAVAGVPRIDIHPPWHYLGVMDPGCGGTRATYLLTQGEFRRAVTYNPGAPFFTAGAGLVLMRAAIGRVTRFWVTPVLPVRLVMIVAVIAVAALWVNQQLHEQLLTSPWTG